MSNEPNSPAARPAIWGDLEAIAKRITNHYTAGAEEDQHLGVAITDLREALRAGAADRAPAPQAEGWQPIETAPKNRNSRTKTRSG